MKIVNRIKKNCPFVFPLHYGAQIRKHSPAATLWPLLWHECNIYKGPPLLNFPTISFFENERWSEGINKLIHKLPVSPKEAQIIFNFDVVWFFHKEAIHHDKSRAPSCITIQLRFWNFVYDKKLIYLTILWAFAAFRIFCIWKTKFFNTSFKALKCSRNVDHQLHLLIRYPEKNSRTVVKPTHALLMVLLS